MEYKTLYFDKYMQNDEEIKVFIDKIIGHHPAHAHDFIEIAYIDAGRGTHIVNGNEEEICEGNLFLFNAYNIVHEFNSYPDTPLIVYNCLFQPLSIDNSFKGCKNFVDVAYYYLFHSLYTKDKHKEYIKLTDVKSSEIKKILYEMQFEHKTKENGYMQILKADLMKLLIQMFRMYKNDETQKQSLPIYKRLIVQEATEFLKDHYQECIKCERLAQRAYLSVNYFGKIFKEITGMTMIQLLQNIRINVACDLLESSDLTMIDIAHKVGYSDIKHFYKIFRRIKSVPPGEYKMRHIVEIRPNPD